MTRADRPLLLYLDFDGVVCDSERECFVSSWLTYRQLGGATGGEHISLRARRRFRQMRPLIRSGEDYVVIQQILAREQAEAGFHGPATVPAFDAYRDALGQPVHRPGSSTPWPTPAAPSWRATRRTGWRSTACTRTCAGCWPPAT